MVIVKTVGNKVVKLPLQTHPLPSFTLLCYPESLIYRNDIYNLWA